MSPEVADAVRAAGLDPDDVEILTRRALQEDLCDGEDITSMATIPPDDTSTADFVARREGVVAGVPVLLAVLDLGLGPSSNYSCVATSLTVHAFQRGDIIATVSARTIPLLTIERTSLNVLCRLSGVATLTRRWVDTLAGLPARVRDTRKTTPGLRTLEKYAVRCGGGVNHRFGLHDAVLIKDNHVAAAGGVGAALDAVWRRLGPDPDTVVQIEVDSLDELDEALAHGATQVLLDNMDIEAMAEAVRRVRAVRPEVLIEASGGLGLETARAVAGTGQRLTVGALTHSAPILDIALDFR